MKGNKATVARLLAFTISICLATFSSERSAVGPPTRGNPETEGQGRASEVGQAGRAAAKLDGKGLARLKRLLAAGKSQAECATLLGVSTRTIGRAVALAAFQCRGGFGA
jgi:hypothetical protein